MKFMLADIKSAFNFTNLLNSCLKCWSPKNKENYFQVLNIPYCYHKVGV